MSFAHPELFWLLLLLPGMAYVYFFREHKRVTDFRFPTIQHIRQRSQRSCARQTAAYPFLLRVIGLLLLDHRTGPSARVSIAKANAPLRASISLCALTYRPRWMLKT